MTTKSDNSSKGPDVVLIGAGIMSATLGVMLKELEPNITIEIYERLDVAAAESSDAWNNAGTGHAAFCELNYTPELENGSVNISKAVKVAESFEESRQFWSYLVEKGFLDKPESFIKSIPHISFVWGENNVNFLRKRHQALTQNPLFKGMEYAEDKETLLNWMPLVMEGRDASQKVAGTKMDIGTDVNFGALTRCMFSQLKQMPGVKIHFAEEVDSLKQDRSGRWKITMKNLKTGDKKKVSSKFVFIGAGGGSLPLLIKSGIPEGKGYGGFPVSGQWLKCTNPEIIAKHEAKVYGKAAVGSPPMSVPHLDSRMIGGKKALLFGPYAGFTTKFLKNGSILDLFKSVKISNIKPMLAAGIDNIPLTKYLIDQVKQSPEERLEALKEYFPSARMEDWELEIAGQRVQVIKKDEKKGGVLEFGTEVVSAADGSIAALLGASPGASTTVSIMINLLGRCFKEKMKTAEWQAKIKQMVPSHGIPLSTNAELCYQIRNKTAETLKLTKQEEVTV
ncbi:malate:quinone oxidoreductase [Desertivirga arenae]|uniref:malate:quinone oxidoreductase n=1 Tax=Desertivirga arenae TaxID=2810309 RepID=UPI001A958135|nr:malate:quinone oxidoreductase [Pedobacter sp. SYSU D00823]